MNVHSFLDQLDALDGDWREDDHGRNHGKFAAKGTHIKNGEDPSSAKSAGGAVEGAPKTQAQKLKPQSEKIAKRPPSKSLSPQKKHEQTANVYRDLANQTRAMPGEQESSEHKFFKTAMGIHDNKAWRLKKYGDKDYQPAFPGWGESTPDRDMGGGSVWTGMPDYKEQSPFHGKMKDHQDAFEDLMKRNMAWQAKNYHPEALSEAYGISPEQGQQLSDMLKGAAAAQGSISKKIAPREGQAPQEDRETVDKFSEKGDFRTPSDWDVAQKLLKKSKLDLTPTEAGALTSYTNNGYKPINNALRSGSMDADTQKYHDLLNSALDRMPTYEGKTHRGIQISPEQIAQYKPGTEFVEKGFMSTSMGSTEQQSLGNCHFIIQGRNGKSVKSMSFRPDEEEVLYKAGTRFKVVSNDGKTVTIEEV